MSAALLARLKVKNQPKRPDAVDIVIKLPEERQEVEIKTKIIDRRADLGFNREQFLQALEPVRTIKHQKQEIPEVQVQVDVQAEPEQPTGARATQKKESYWNNKSSA